MIQITLRASGFGETQAELTAFGAEAGRIGERFTHLTLTESKDTLAQYPPAPRTIRTLVSDRRGPRGGRRVRVRQRRGRTYVRTGRLGRAWKVTEAGTGRWTLSNNARSRGRPYPRFVHGGANGQGQAWMHVGRWRLMVNVVRERTRVNQAMLAAALRRLAREKGLGSRQ